MIDSLYPFVNEPSGMQRITAAIRRKDALSAAAMADMLDSEARRLASASDGRVVAVASAAAETSMVVDDAPVDAVARDYWVSPGADLSKAPLPKVGSVTVAADDGHIRRLVADTLASVDPETSTLPDVARALEALRKALA